MVSEEEQRERGVSSDGEETECSSTAGNRENRRTMRSDEEEGTSWNRFTPN